MDGMVERKNAALRASEAGWTATNNPTSSLHLGYSEVYPNTY